MKRLPEDSRQEGGHPQLGPGRSSGKPPPWPLSRYRAQSRVGVQDGPRHSLEFNNAEALLDTHTQFDHRVPAPPPRTWGKRTQTRRKVPQPEPRLHRQDGVRGGRERLQAHVRTSECARTVLETNAAFLLGESTGNSTI